jgi:preprotein translocase subunit YajC
MNEKCFCFGRSVIADAHAKPSTVNLLFIFVRLFAVLMFLLRRMKDLRMER